MSNADKMFEELHFKKKDLFDLYEEKWGEQYYNDNNLAEITFDITDKEIAVYCEDSFEAVYFGMQELQAINEKCKELGWL